MEIAVAVLAMAVLFFVITTLVTRKMKIAKPYNTLYVLITGCDTGFGRELAYRLDHLGFNVIATCLTDAGAYQLSQNTSGNLHTTILDVTKLDQIENVFERVKSILPNEKGNHLYIKSCYFFKTNVHINVWHGDTQIIMQCAHAKRFPCIQS